MSLNQHAEAEPPALDTVSCRALFDRVKASQAFSRSPRLRQLLDYLCDQSMADPGLPLTEERIGVEVFGRTPGYDTGGDTIVRVQVSQLRRKLEHYFLSEGASEAVVIELPKRSYMPVFRVRGAVAQETDFVETGAGPLKWRTVSGCLAALLVLAVWLLFAHSDFGARASAGLVPMPYRDHFWRQFFSGGRQTQLITSDANVMAICDFLGRTLTPPEYIGNQYPEGLIDAQLQDPTTRRVLRNIASNFVTNMPDLRVANRLSLIAASAGGRFNTVFARDFRYQPQTPDNLIFLSHRKANPWVGLFEERINFQYEFDSGRNTAALVNRAPKAGEDQRYPVDWGVQTYALIAYMRKPVGEGMILLLEGGDTTGAEAGCHLLTDESRIKGLYHRLGITTSGRTPEFEVLLRAKLLRGFVHEYEIVAHRILSDNPAKTGTSR
jgi:hypothetical protein